MPSKDIIVGDIVDVMTKDDGIPYRTKIEDIMPNDQMTAVVPTAGGEQMLVHYGDEIYMTYYRETGKFTTRVKVLRLYSWDNIRYMTMVQISEPEKDQRRLYFRLPVRLRAILCEYVEGFDISKKTLEHIVEAEVIALEIAGTKDLSITGVAILSKNDYEQGTKFVVELFMDEKAWEQAKPFVICAEIMRTDFEKNNKLFRLGMQFFGQTHNMSEFLAKYVLTQQQKQLRQKRLVEGE